MADRVVRYVFTGTFTSLTAGLAASSKAVGDLGVKMTALDKNGARMRTGLTTIGTTAGKIGLVAAAGLAAVVGVTARFDKAMSAVQAATHETAANMDLLRNAAIQAGAKTVYSASEAASAIEELAKAGISTKDILAGGLAGALDLASAGALDVGRAAEIAATAMTQFKLEGSDVEHVADLLAAGAGKAQGSVDDLGMALKQSGLVAAQTGLSIEETTGTLAAFASAGLIGSDAGTSFKTMLQALTPSGKQAREEMEKLGISAYDAQGNFIGMTEFAGNLRDGLKGLTTEQQNAALKIIFGSDAVRAASVIYDQGANGIQKWIDKTNDAGYAAETAATRLDNLSGDLEQLKGSLETALIGAGEGSQAPLRSLVQDMTKVVNAFNSAPPAIQGTVTKLLALTAITGGAAWFGSKVINGIAGTKKALADLGVQAGTTNRALSTIGKGFQFYAMIEGIKLLDNELGDLFNRRLNDSTLARDLTAFANGDVVGNLDKIDSYLTALNSTASKVTDKVFGILPGKTEFSEAKDEINKIDEALAQMVESGNADQAARIMEQIAKQGADAGISLADTTKQFDQYNLALKNIPGSGKGIVKLFDQMTGGALSVALGLRKMTDAEKAAHASHQKSAEVLKAEAEALKKSRDAAHETAGGFVNLGKGLDNAKLSLKGWLRQLENQAEALRNFRENAEKAADRGLRQGLIAALEEAGPAGALRLKQLANATDKEIGRANRAWQSGQREIKKYTDAVGGVPKKAGTKLELTGVPTALQQLHSVQSALAAIHDKTVHVDIVRGADSGLAYVSGGNRADGGYISGPGGPRDDKIPAMLSNGEFVVNAAATSRNLSLLHRLNAQKFANGGLAGSTFARSSADDAADALDKVAEKAKKTSVAFEWVSGGLVAELKVRQKLLQHEVDRDKQRLDMLKQERDSLAEAIKNRFGDSPFGQTSNTGGPPQAPTLTADMTAKERAEAQAEYDAQLSAYQAQNAANSPTAILQQQLADAREMRKLLKQLQALGLSGPALAQVATTASIEEMRALLSSGRGGINQYEHLLGAVGQISGQIGSSVASAVFDNKIGDERKELREHTAQLKALNEKVDALTKPPTLHKIENAVEEGTRKGNKGGHSAQGHRRAGT